MDAVLSIMIWGLLIGLVVNFPLPSLAIMVLMYTMGFRVKP